LVTRRKAILEDRHGRWFSRGLFERGKVSRIDTTLPGHGRERQFFQERNHQDGFMVAEYRCPTNSGSAMIGRGFRNRARRKGLSLAELNERTIFTLG
jgi:hypothetical protein